MSLEKIRMIVYLTLSLYSEKNAMKLNYFPSFVDLVPSNQTWLPANPLLEEVKTVHFGYVLLLVSSCMCFTNESTIRGINCATLTQLNMRKSGSSNFDK